MSDFTNDVSRPSPSQPPMPAVQAQLPIGTIIAFAGKVTAPYKPPDPSHHKTNPEPMGWLVCDGRALYIAEFPDLYEAIGTIYGKEGDSTFKIPDYRGYFLRGLDDGKGKDPDRDDRTAAAPGGQKTGVGSIQEDAVQTHAHKYKAVTLAAVADTGDGAGTGATLQLTENGPVTALGKPDVNVSDHETRPKNKYVHYLIKAF